jgi:sugar phosphate isomerase/epimerase
MNYSMMSYSLARQGFNPCEIIKTTSELGLKWIDWLSTYNENPRILYRLCEEAGIKISAYTFFLPDFQAGKPEWPSQLAKEMDTAAELHAPLSMLGTPGLEFEVSRKESQKLWLEALKAYVDISNKYHIVPTIENYPGESSPMVSSSDYKFFSANLPELMLTFDPGNAMTGGEWPIDCIHHCSDQIVHVHFKDWTISNIPKPGAKRLLDGRFYTPALVGDGDMEYPVILEELHRIGYKGCVNIEYESDAIPAREAMRQALRYLRQIEAETINTLFPEEIVKL